MFFGGRNMYGRFVAPGKSKDTDIAAYEREFTVDNGKAYISCNINGMEDLVNGYSLKGHETPSPGLITYVDINARHIPEEYPIVLKICGGDISEGDKTTFRSALSDFYAARLSDADARLAENLRNALFQLVIGAIFFCLYLVLNSFDAITLTLQLCMWFFIWEFADMIWLGRRTLKAERKQASRMADIKVEFEEKGGDGI